DKDQGHMNAIIIDMVRKQFILFEPDFPVINIDEFQQIMRQKINNSAVFHDVKYIICDFHPQQQKGAIIKGDPLGFCIAWCIWFLDYRLKYHYIDLNNLVDIANKQLTKDFLDFKMFIRQYAAWLIHLNQFQTQS